MRLLKSTIIVMIVLVLSWSNYVLAQEALTPLPKKEIKREEFEKKPFREIPKHEVTDARPITDEQIIIRAIDDLLSKNIRRQHQAEKRLLDYGTVAIPYLIKALRRPEFKLHLAISKVSIAIGEKGEEAFLEVLNNETSKIRWHAAKILGNIGTKRSVLSLIRAIDDPVVRPTAVDALGLLGDKRAIPPLEALMDSDDEFVKMLVKRALKNLGVKTELPQWEF